MWTAKKFYITHCNRSPVSANNNTPLPQPTNSIFSHACKQNCVIATCIKWARRIDSNDGYTQRNIKLLSIGESSLHKSLPWKKVSTIWLCSHKLQFISLSSTGKSSFIKLEVTHRIEKTQSSIIDFIHIPTIHGKDNSCKASRWNVPIFFTQ